MHSFFFFFFFKSLLRLNIRVSYDVYMPYQALLYHIDMGLREYDLVPGPIL